MRRFFCYLLLMVMGFLPGISLTYAQNFTITKVGEWGSGKYEDVFVRGNYAYCVMGNGLDIIDISDPSKPVRVGNVDTPDQANAVFVNGSYAYVADYQGGLQIIDVSTPSDPVPSGQCNTSGDARGVFATSQYAFVAAAEGGLDIIDISDPSLPVLKGNCATSGYVEGVYVKGNYAYAADYYNGLDIIDISDPSAPVRAGNYDSPGHGRRVVVMGNYAYMASGYEGLEVIDITTPTAPTLAGQYKTSRYTRAVHVSGNTACIGAVYIEKGDNKLALHVIDISDPTAPTGVGSYDTRGGGFGVFMSGNLVYAANYDYGLWVFDISTPTDPNPVGYYWNTTGWLNEVYVNGNYAYVGDMAYGLHIIDVSDPTSPLQEGLYETSAEVKDVYVKGKYAYLVDRETGFQIIDISTPSAPFRVGGVGVPGLPYTLFISGNHAYITADGLSIIDISNPDNPFLTGFDYYYAAHWLDIYVTGHYAYVANLFGELIVFNIADPYDPKQIGAYEDISPHGVWGSGNYIYAADENGLLVFDVSEPAVPSLVGHSNIAFTGENVRVIDDYAYVADREYGLRVFDVSRPSYPIQVGSYNISTGYIHTVFVRGDYVYMTDYYKGKLFILQVDKSTAPPRIDLNRRKMYFASNNAGASTGQQSFLVTNSGGGTLNWSISANKAGVIFLPGIGTNTGEVRVSIKSRDLAPGTYTTTLSVSAPNAVNSPQAVEVILEVYAPGQTSKPFGAFSTPLEGPVVSGSVPVTGWALDDIGIQSVRLFRKENGGWVYIGDAVLVQGARPDIREAYPDYPLNYKAGWGYMMLTHFLPNGGNGTYTIRAVATDMEGHQVTLGTKAITVDNANAVKPFGTIDTPAQGDTVWGSDYVNFGWALTPLPNTIPIDGSTINVWLDGVDLGSPVYNQYREDIALLFPNNNNSSGAVGYFYLDTGQYENGLHTIQWTVTDDAGNTDGIGSRYFNIQNFTGLRSAGTAARNHLTGRTLRPFMKHGPVEEDTVAPVWVRKGFVVDEELGELYPEHNGEVFVEIKELERLEIALIHPGELPAHPGNITVETLYPLPIGASLDAQRGIFTWMPGVGFVGDYFFAFLANDASGNVKRKNIRIRIRPKF